MTLIRTTGFVLIMFVASLAHGQTTWIAPGSGSWHTGSNWSTGSVPQNNSDVIIDVPGLLANIAVNGNASVNTLNSQESMTFSGPGFFSIANGGSISGPITVSGSGFSLNVGGNFTASGPVNLNGSNINANVQAGQVADFSGMTSYTAQFNGSGTIGVNGGGTLVFANLQYLRGTTSGTGRLTLRSSDNSLLDISSLPQINGGAVRFEAIQGGVIDISQSSSYHNSNSDRDSSFEASSGGTINASGMTSLSSNFGQFNSATNLTVRVDGNSSSIDFSSLSTLRNATVHLLNGGSLDLSAVTDFDYSSFNVVGNGSTLNLSGVGATWHGALGNTVYSRNWTVDGQSTIQAGGLGSLESLKGPGSTGLTVTAKNDGVIDLSSVQNAKGVNVRAHTNGLIDLSSLLSLDDSTLDADSGGEIRLGGGAGTLVLYGSTVVLRADGNIDTSRDLWLTSNSVIESYGVNRALNITQLDSSVIHVYDGGNISLPQLTGALTTGGPSSSTQLIAEGAGSTLSASGLTSMSTSSGSGHVAIDVIARDGGVIDLQQVQTITALSGANASRPVNVLAEGAASIVDLDGLASFADLASKTESTVTARNGGFIVMGGQEHTQLTNVDVTVETGGVIQGHAIELISQFTPGNFGDDDFSTLVGDGLINAHLVNTSGIVTPGSALAALTILGNYTQGADADLIIEIDSSTAFNRLDVFGNAMLDGDLFVSLADGFDLQSGMEFLFMDVAGTAAGEFDGLLQNRIVLSDNGFDLRINYFGGDGNDLSFFSAASIPEPAAGLLVSGIIIGLLLHRPRR